MSDGLPKNAGLFDVFARPNVINYVVDGNGWVQHRRAAHLSAHQSRYELRIIPIKRFQYLWKLGLLRNQPALFTSWRLARQLLQKDPSYFGNGELQHFLAAVTSHSNIGGGLDPHNPIPGRTPKNALEDALSYLRRFKVVTANSIALVDFLKPHLPDILYCPNGVDHVFFTPATEKPSFDSQRIRVGWVGKERAAKNFGAIAEAFDQLNDHPAIEPRLIKIDKTWKAGLLTPLEMREYYRDIDFYLCASWNEGTPNPGLEAAACGVPVISTRVGNMRELIQDGLNGFFIEPSTDSIVECLQSLENLTPEDYDRISYAVRSDIEREWTWRRRIPAFETAFDRLVN